MAGVTTSEETIELAAHALLASTEELCAAIAEGQAAEEFGVAYMRREQAFEELRVVTRPGDSLSPGVRDCLDRVRVLDSELLSLGKTLSDVLRGEQHSLHRRRAAIQAHAAREREQPRLVTLKA